MNNNDDFTWDRLERCLGRGGALIKLVGESAQPSDKRRACNDLIVGVTYGGWVLLLYFLKSFIESDFNMLGEKMLKEFLITNDHDIVIEHAFRELDITKNLNIKFFEKTNTEKTKEWYDICSECFPSDELLITGNVLRFTENFLLSIGFSKDSITIPDDLILSRKVPLPNIIFRMPNDDNLHTYRFVLHDFDLYLVDTLDPKNLYETLSTRPKTFSTISKFKHVDNSYVADLEEVYITDSNMDINNQNLKIKTRQSLINYYRSCYNFNTIMLQTWYAIQVLLLHPQIVKSDLFKKDRKVKISENNLLLKKSSKRKTRYIKRETINVDIFNHKDFVRKTQCWYVIGHYRKLGTKKIWVNGYWKGPLRDYKKNFDSDRERIIVSNN